MKCLLQVGSCAGSATDAASRSFPPGAVFLSGDHVEQKDEFQGKLSATINQRQDKENSMKAANLIGLMMSAALFAGCAGTGGSAGTAQAGGQATASAATSDATITQGVKTALAADPETAGITPESEQGKVRLKGEVKSVTAFQKAAAAAKKVPGVVAVDNQVIVCMTCK
jgi:osmotically-inducible protein OsmY